MAVQIKYHDGTGHVPWSNCVTVGFDSPRYVVPGGNVVMVGFDPPCIQGRDTIFYKFQNAKHCKIQCFCNFCVER